MANTIKLKRSSTAGATPTAGSLEYGELALNYTDGNLFFKTAANVVTLLASTQTANYSGNVTGGNLRTAGTITANGGVYGEVVTTQFASVWGSGAGPNPYSIMQVRASDNVSGIGMQAYTGTGTLYANTAIQFGLATIRDKDVPSNLVVKAYIDSTGLNVTGIVSASGNVTAGNLSTGGSLSVIGNTTVGNISVDIGKFIDVGNNRIMNVAEPVANSDAATRGYVDSITSSGFTVQDDTANTTVVSAGDTLQLYGTANEVTVEITNPDQVTFGLPDNVTVTGNISAGNLSTTGLLSVSGNASAGNISTAGKVTASGNVAGSYFIGDGSFLTNLPAQAGNAISNGTSNVAITSASGNVTVGINGTANTVVISPGSLFVNGVFATPKTITSNVQVAADSSAMVISPLTIGNGYSMSIPNSSTVYIWIPS